MPHAPHAPTPFRHALAAAFLSLLLPIAAFAQPSPRRAPQPTSQPATTQPAAQPDSRALTPPAAAPALRVVVTIPPLRGIVEPLLPDASTVRVLMPPGRSEHGYEFTPRDLAEVARADLVVFVGLGLEPRVEQAVRRDPRPTREDISFADAVGIMADDHSLHHHGPDGECVQGATDPHLWLDPALVAKLVPEVASRIRASLDRRGVLTPALRDDLAQRERSLLARIQAVDDSWRIRLAPFQGRAIVTHHNAFPRPAERYGLRVAAVIRGFENAEPTPGKLAEVVEAIRRERVRAIFAEPQYSRATADRIARAAGVRVARLDPLGDGDWFAMMGANLDTLTANLGER